MGSMAGVFAVLGAMAGLIAGTMAYLITYDEYRRHYVLDPRPAIRHALEMALVTAVFFFMLTMVAGYFIERIFA